MMIWNGLYFHSPNSYMLELISSMHDFLMMFLLSILFLVCLNITYSFYIKNFNLDFLENHQIESIWTISPFLLLTFIIVPSLASLYMLDACSFCGMTISIMGHQWYWSYFYKDYSSLFFDSYMESPEFSQLRLVEVDNRLIIPSSFPIRFLVSSSDVIHSWTVPSFGVKMDAIPGRINQFCFLGKRSGVFFGQCSEICGANHSFMPIVVELIPFDNFLKCMTN